MARKSSAPLAARQHRLAAARQAAKSSNNTKIAQAHQLPAGSPPKAPAGLRQPYTPPGPVKRK